MWNESYVGRCKNDGGYVACEKVAQGIEVAVLRRFSVEESAERIIIRNLDYSRVRVESVASALNCPTQIAGHSL